MTTKLTLTIEETIIKKAKHYARSTGRSLSELVEAYLENIVEKEPTQNLSGRLNKITGAVKLPANFDEKKELRSLLEQKHL